MTEAIPGPEASDYYGYDRQPVDETLLNARDLILRYADNSPRLPIGEDEQFDPSIHSYETPSDSLSSEERGAAKTALELLVDRYAEISRPGEITEGRSQLERVRAMLSKVQNVWVAQYLQVHAEQVSHLDYTDWVEWVIRYHPNHTLNFVNNVGITPYYPVYRAHDDLTLNVMRGKDKFQLPGLIIAPPNITVTASEESSCYVARWDAIGTDSQLDVPVDSHVRQELLSRGLLPHDPLAFDARAAGIARMNNSRATSN